MLVGVSVASVTMVVAILVLGGVGSWLAKKSDSCYELARKSSYREFYRLQHLADRYGVLYVLTAFACVAIYPIGLIGAAWVIGFAAYLRFR